MLKMDHLPDGSIREITTRKQNGEPQQEIGFVSGSLLDKYKEDGAEIKKAADISKDKGKKSVNLLTELRKTDPKIGDKIMFDYLIGNTDRHQNNFFVKEKGDVGAKSYEMLDFDHGLTFGNSNNALINHNGYGYNGWDGAARTWKILSEITKITPEFANSLNDIVNDVEQNNGGQFKELTSYIEQKIGKTEASAFIDRFSDVVEGVLGNNNKHLSAIINNVSNNYINDGKQQPTPKAATNPDGIKVKVASQAKKIDLGSTPPSGIGLTGIKKAS